MKYLLILLLALPFATCAQSDYLIDENDEKIMCKNLTVAKNGKGEVFMISYISGAGKKVTFNDAKNIPAFKEYSKSGRRYVLAPIKAEKPTGDKAYIQLVQDGKIQLFADQLSRNYTPTKGGSKSASLNRLFVKIDNEWMDANNKKSFEKTITSRMMKCMAFIQKHKARISNDLESLSKAIEVYNENC